MILQTLLVAVLVLSCVALVTVNHDSTNVLTYPSRVINTTTQLGCPSDKQLETVIAEVKQDIRSLLHQVGKSMYVQVILKSIHSSYMGLSTNCFFMQPNVLLRLPKFIQL